MTNAELIETLRCCAASDCEHCPKNMEPICPSMTELFNAAADALEAADAYEEAWSKKCERLEKRIAESEWIKCSDAPEVEGYDH